MRVLRDSHPEDPARESGLSLELLREIARDGGPPTLRVYRPGPTVAFGRLDALSPGIGAAFEAARAHGFTPLMRAQGGHAAAYHDGCVGIDELRAHDDAIPGTQERFEHAAARLAATLRGLGVDARVGEVAGEYCPGRFSVNAGGTVKLAGIAQRVVRGASLVSSMVVCERPGPLRAVLVDVYEALGLELDPATVGAAGIAPERFELEVASRG